MPRKGLTRQSVIDAAVALIEEKGYHAFSLNELARRLDIKPASLYNHIENIEELTNAVRFRIAQMLRQTEFLAIEGKNRDEALFALCDAYYAFAWDHIELYKVNMGRQKERNTCSDVEFDAIVDPIFQVLTDFQISESQKYHWHRILRASMHGFITQEYAGSFRQFPVDRKETYRMAIETILLGIHNAEKEM